MITLRKSEDRGPSNFGWLDSKHTFSFGRYHDPKNMGFGNLRVINDDRVNGGKGFDAHPHNNMEIITYVIEGALEHKDDMGTGSVIKAGDVQHMSAGTGIVHSEFNHSLTDQVHFLQIWIMPKEHDIKPQYNQKYFDENEKLNKLVKIISHDGSKNSIRINQDINIFASIINQEVEIKHPLSKEKDYWIHVVKGSVDFQEYNLKEGDGIVITNEDLSEISFQSSSTGEFLLFELSIG